MRARRTQAVTSAAMAMLLFGPTVAGAVSQRLRYRFDTATSPVTTVVDDSGKGHTGTVHSANGGTVSTVPGYEGLGVRFPAVCSGTGCPHADITTPDAADLNPGTAPFTFGARVRLTLADLSADHGSNIVQKGLYNTPQWKLQLDDAVTGRPSCVLRTTGGADAIVVKASVGVADGAWHKVSCQRTSSTVTIFIDNIARGSALISATYDISPVGQPVSIGAKGTGTNNDQFHGAIDDVYFNLD
ncbi:LamG domain-containing protein [Pyxidicoccus fallax]|uniref:LamG domain-containing protein n=1 Tax=Pyxidicoccus fallax TaxID=394095 RepID=A0A848LGG1_9BACT|nr:laminin G domain-containing protein [Pyxidicoccus fallax]NMO16593.1 LamG domain-containing protein [Pyxidicoccus fallax]NPC78374.1 LamG domain-containing protein [Pyxidicoccus fallax]